MKKIYKSFTLLLAALAVTACGTDWLDLSPAGGTSSDVAISNYADALTARTGMYDGLQGTSTYRSYYAARMTYYGDVRGEDMQARTTGMRSSGCYEMTYGVDDAPDIWNIPYNLLRRANNLIKAIDDQKVTDATEAQIGKIYAEARVMRALVHFDLVRVYGKTYSDGQGASYGIPVVLEPLDGNQLPTRSTVAEVYTQVIKDLTESINTGYLATTKTQGYFNVWTAKALLARVYLYMEKNSDALSVAEDIIKNSPYKLWTNAEYANAWQKDNSAHQNEIIFEILNASNDDWTDREGLAYLYHEDGYADAIVTQAFSTMLAQDPDDVRNEVVLAATDEDFVKLYGTTRVFINKYPADPATGDMRMNNIPLFRLSEVYLTAAEAAAKSNNPTKAAEYLNVIAQRANPDAAVISGTDATLDRIIIERRKELVGEGQRFFDAMRNNETVVRYTSEADKGFHSSLSKDSQSFNRSYYRTILPIPESEVNANQNIAEQQNPQY